MYWHQALTLIQGCQPLFRMRTPHELGECQKEKSSFCLANTERNACGWYIPFHKWGMSGSGSARPAELFSCVALITYSDLASKVSQSFPHHARAIDARRLACRGTDLDSFASNLPDSEAILMLYFRCYPLYIAYNRVGGAIR